ncbi:hypothetical protein, partial [Streptomyces mesophilus]|uniref:hypothetical protein n=1 Tax=Streptomyces mesophilus TaxID=1775132 RepID=UPI003355921C
GAAGAATNPRSPSSGPSRIVRNLRILVAPLLLIAGAYVFTSLADAREDGSGGEDESFPEAKYEITRPPELVGGTYKLVGADFLPKPVKLEDTEVRKDAFEIPDDYYTGSEKASFDRLRISAEYGRFKEPGDQLKSKISYLVDTGDGTTEEPLEKIKVPGHKTEFSCRSARSATYEDVSVCGWADANTVVVLQFEGYDAIQRAAEATAAIYKEIRRPVAEQGS